MKNKNPFKKDGTEKTSCSAVAQGSKRRDNWHSHPCNQEQEYSVYELISQFQLNLMIFSRVLFLLFSHFFFGLKLPLVSRDITSAMNINTQRLVSRGAKAFTYILLTLCNQISIC